MLFLGIILESILEGIWLVFESTFGAFGGQKVAKCHQQKMRKLTLRKVASEEARTPDTSASWVAGGG